METCRPPPEFAQTRLFWIAWVIKWTQLSHLIRDLCSTTPDLSFDLTIDGVFLAPFLCLLHVHPFWFSFVDRFNCLLILPVPWIQLMALTSPFSFRVEKYAFDDPCFRSPRKRGREDPQSETSTSNPIPKP